jgi:hypothetical protein
MERIASRSIRFNDSSWEDISFSLLLTGRKMMLAEPTP